MALPKKYYDKKNCILSVPPSISKTKKWYHFILCETAVELIDLMISRYPDDEYLFPNRNYEKKLSNWEKKVATGKLDEDSVPPKKFMKSDLLTDNIESYCEQKNVDSFIPRDFRRTFKTLGGQLKITKEIRDRIQHHALHDVSSVHY